MDKEDLDRLSGLSGEDLRAEIPDLDWFWNLKEGDEAVLSLIGMYFFRNDLWDNAFTLVKVTKVYEDGSVEINRGNLGRFYFCVRLCERQGWERRQMNIRLIPPRDELIKKLREKDSKIEQEVEEEFNKIDWGTISIFKKMEILASIGKFKT